MACHPDCQLSVQEAVKAGKVKHLGVSEVSPADIRKVHQIHPVSLVELEWSLVARDAEVRPEAFLVHGFVSDVIRNVLSRADSRPLYLHQPVIQKLNGVRIMPASSCCTGSVHHLLGILQAGQVCGLWLQKELIPTCRELGIGMLAYSPMGRGILTGAFKPEELPADDFRTKVPDTYYSKENLEVVGPCSRSSHDDWLNH